jgi:hypothetical protein
MMNNLRGKRTAKVVFAVAALLTGCHAQSDPAVPRATPNLPPSAAALDLDAEIARAFKDKRPVVVLVADSGQNDADAEPKSLLNASTRSDKSDDVVRLVLDLSVSRNRATAARFHITDTDTPLLVCLSPRGVIVSRDEQPITSELVLKRIEEVSERSRQIDAKLVTLEEALARNVNDAAAQLALADFLLAQENACEAIPHLASVAHSEAADTNLRVRAWVDLARAHLWIGEPEKGRHEAADLIAKLGPEAPEALAGGNLIHGLQDANAKRTVLARQEFAAAIAAAPESTYAKQAAEALAKLPKVEK